MLVVRLAVLVVTPFEADVACTLVNNGTMRAGGGGGGAGGAGGTGGTGGQGSTSYTYYAAYGSYQYNIYTFTAELCRS